MFHIKLWIEPCLYTEVSYKNYLGTQLREDQWQKWDYMFETNFCDEKWFCTAQRYMIAGLKDYCRTEFLQRKQNQNLCLTCPGHLVALALIMILPDSISSYPNFTVPLLYYIRMILCRNTLVSLFCRSCGPEILDSTKHLFTYLSRATWT